MIADLAKRLERAFSAFLHEPKPSPVPPQYARPIGQMGALGTVPGTLPLETDDGRQHRQSVAMAMLDDDLYGFLILRIVGDPNNGGADIIVDAHLEDDCWPGIIGCMSRLAGEVACP